MIILLFLSIPTGVLSNNKLKKFAIIRYFYFHFQIAFLNLLLNEKEKIFILECITINEATWIYEYFHFY